MSIFILFTELAFNSSRFHPAGRSKQLTDSDGIFAYPLGTVRPCLESLSGGRGKLRRSLSQIGVTMQRGRGGGVFRQSKLLHRIMPPALPHVAVQLCQPGKGQDGTGAKMHVPRGPEGSSLDTDLPST